MRADDDFEQIADDLLTVSIPESSRCQLIAKHLRSCGHWQEAVAGIDSVVVQYDAIVFDADAARGRLLADLGSAPEVMAPVIEAIEIPVCYGGEDGPDLAYVSEMGGISPQELIELHTSADYTVEMLGFTPGFAYIGGLPSAFDVPRLAAPRQHVRAGSIGIAGRRTGVYAMPGPGGWPIIGRTPLSLFDPADVNPFLLSPGVTVRFRAIDAVESRRLQNL